MKVKDIIKKSEPVWIPNKSYEETSPKITVILPTFRRAKSGHFSNAVMSVIEQSFQDWELIIVDDASTDGTADLIKLFMEKDSRISCIRHTNNLGLPAISEYEAYIKARGEYIAFVFDDNVWSADHLMLSMNAMTTNNVKFTYGVVMIRTDTEKFRVDGELLSLPSTNVIGNGGVVVHKEVIETIGLYDPHISLAHVCDWDLWKRVYVSFEMLKIDEDITEKNSTDAYDYWGITAFVDRWCSIERMSYARNNVLKPENFGNIEINEVFDTNTVFFRDATEKYYLNYSNKYWYEVGDSYSAQKKSKKRVLIIFDSSSATFSLSFEFLSEYAIIMSTTFDALNCNDIVLSDVVIFLRNSVLATDVIKKYAFLKIPFFFYFDDNYDAVLKSVDKPAAVRVWKQLCENISREKFKPYAGVIVSTDELREYYGQKNIHDRIETLEPCRAQNNTHHNAISEKSVNIAFMGGGFRENVFVEHIYPALIKLSQNKHIRLVCPTTLFERIKKNYDIKENIEIISLPRESCYNQAICKYKSYDISILIHSGENIANNKYKTLNSLINAVELGAVLVTSDIEPYSGNDAITTAKNTSDDWYAALNTLCSDSRLCEERYNAGKAYVDKRYSADVVGKRFLEIISDCECTALSMIVLRYEQVLGKIRKSNNVSIQFIDSLLTFSALDSKENRFIITPPLGSFKSIGVIISSDLCGNKGKLIARLYDSKKRVLGKATMDMSDINLRQINVFTFPETVICPPKVVLSLTAEYEEKFSTVGIYENKAKRGFIYRIFKKLFKIQLPISNLLYYEIY